MTANLDGRLAVHTIHACALMSTRRVANHLPRVSAESSRVDETVVSSRSFHGALFVNRLVTCGKDCSRPAERHSCLN